MSEHNPRSQTQHSPRSQTQRTEESDPDATRIEREENLQSDSTRGQSSAAVASTQPGFKMGVHSVKAGLRMQKEMFDTLQDISRDWVTRAASEAELACTLPGRLRDARSVPDALSAYQQWLREWLDLYGEDRRRLVADGQKVFTTGVRCLAGVSLTAPR
jgi:hypothetical protein